MRLFCLNPRPPYFFTQPIRIYIFDTWLKEGRRYGMGAVRWEVGLGTKARLWQQAGNSSTSARSQWQRDAAASCCGTGRALGAICKQLGSPSAAPGTRPQHGPGNASAVRCLWHKTWEIFSSCEMMLSYTSEINLASATVYICLFIHSFIHFLPQTSAESKSGH